MNGAVWLRIAALGAVLLMTVLALGPTTARAEDPACPTSAGWKMLPAPGLSWINGPYVQRSVHSFSVGTSNAATLYAGTNTGLYESRNCGAEWTPLSLPWSSRATVYGVSVDSSGTLFVGGEYEPLVISEDGGQTWEVTSVRSRNVSVAPTGSGITYGTVHQVLGTRPAVWFARSADHGRTWERISPQFRAPAERRYPFLFRDPIAIADAVDPRVLWSNGAELWHSSDRGDTFDAWESFIPFVGEGYNRDFVISLAMSNDGARFWVATSSGRLFRSRDHGDTWEEVEDTPYGGFLISFAPSQTDARVLFVLTSYGYVWAYREPGEEEPAPTAPCPFDAILGFGRIWRTEKLPRRVGCPVDPERPVRIRSAPIHDRGVGYQPEDESDNWYRVFPGRWDIWPTAANPFPRGTPGERIFEGAVQRFEGGTMLWLTKPDGSHTILVLQEDAWREYPD